MLSVGPQELAILGALLLFLLIFGSSKFSSAARDLGQLLGGAKRTVEDVMSELILEEVNDTHRALEDIDTEVVHSADREERRRKSLILSHQR
jgi:Sec-independent protein translocase protein TatA